MIDNFIPQPSPLYLNVSLIEAPESDSGMSALRVLGWSVEGDSVVPVVRITYGENPTR